MCRRRQLRCVLQRLDGAIDSERIAVPTETHPIGVLAACGRDSGTL